MEIAFGLLIGLVVGFGTGLFIGAALVIRTIYKDGYTIKNGHVVEKDEAE